MYLLWPAGAGSSSGRLCVSISSIHAVCSNFTIHELCLHVYIGFSGNCSRIIGHSSPVNGTPHHNSDSVQAELRPAAAHRRAATQRVLSHGGGWRSGACDGGRVGMGRGVERVHEKAHAFAHMHRQADSHAFRQAVAARAGSGS